MIEVLEVDQWTSTGDLVKFTWEQCISGQAKGRVRGGDSEAAAAIFGGHFQLLKALPGARPPIGHVWYTRGEDGYPKLYATNYDSSD